MTKNFGIQNYLRMYRARGIRLPINYFLEAHLFDLLHKTDTHEWLPREDHIHPPVNFERGTMYMCSWSSEIKEIFKFIFDYLNSDFGKYVFLDIGCGKGKVNIIWEMECRKRGVVMKNVGIDYYEPLLEVAMVNFRNLFGNPGKFLLEDATMLDYSQFGEKIIVYLFNPFDEKILDGMLKRFTKIDPIIIYNNPVHRSVISHHGYREIAVRNGFHANLHTVIYDRR